MRKIKLNLDKKCKYVIACSFGPDSMALLDAAMKENLDIVVAHVNYHKRDVSNFEEESLKKYCEERKIICEVLDTTGMEHKGNFQEWARDIRYAFFKKVLEKHHCDYVLVAHQQDDVIETYLMQKKRGIIVKNWGIARENEIQNMKVLRPLLDYTKLDLLYYDQSNNVPYSIDESNLRNDYTRNKFRHEIVEKLSTYERAKLTKEISEKASEKFESKTEFLAAEFLELSYEKIVKNLSYFMDKKKEHFDLSKSFISEVKKAFKNKVNISFQISPSILLEKDYEKVYLIDSSKFKFYSFDGAVPRKADFIEFDFKNGLEDRGILEDPANLLVQTLNPKDKLQVKDYSSEVRRLFIDWKMPLFLRKIWPGIYSKDGKLLYVPRYRETFEDNHKSVLKIDVKYFTNFD